MSVELKVHAGHLGGAVQYVVLWQSEGRAWIDGSRDGTLGSPGTGTLPVSHRCSPDICEKCGIRGVVVDTLGLG